MFRKELVLSGLAKIFQIIRYYTVGALINFVGYFLFIIFLRAGINYKVAATLVYVLSAIISFWLNRKFVFESSNTFKSSFLKLILMLIIGCFINIFILFVFVDKFNLDSRIAILFSIVIVSLFFYGFNKYIIHRDINGKSV